MISNLTNEHSYTSRVYYEDTDAEGVVYYANYLKFMERARSEMIIALNYLPSLTTNGNDDVMFIVRKAEVEYLTPARLYDEIEVITKVAKAGGASIIFEQIIRNKHNQHHIYCTGLITVVCVNHQLKPCRIPATLKF